MEAWVVRVMWVNASPVLPHTTTLTYSVQFQGSRHIELYGIHGFGMLLLCVRKLMFNFGLISGGRDVTLSPTPV